MRKLLVFALMTFFLLVAAENDALYCASIQSPVLAEINGETIDETALIERINAIHRYKPPVQPEGGAGSFKILGLLEEMVDERLMIQEAYRLELDKEPDFEKKLQSYITSYSVIRLRQEEVLDKVDISEQDLLDYFNKHYNKEDPAPEDEFEKRKRKISKKLKKEKEKELSDNFVKMLKEQADIWIDKKLLDSLDPEKDYTGKKSVIARVNGQAIPIDAMLQDMRQAFQKKARMYNRLKTDSEQKKMREDLKQQTLDSLVTYKLVEQEALKRNYINDPFSMEVIAKRKEQLLINDFKEKIVYPLAIPTKKELTKYYEEHINDFRKGYEVWFREMIFSTREDAEKALVELKEGANFQYLAARVSERWVPKKAQVWINTDRFPSEIKKELIRLNVGQISDVLTDGRQYKIIKVKGKRGGAPEEFTRVLGSLKKILGAQKFKIVLSDYLARLRKKSKVKIDNKAMGKIEKRYCIEPTEEANAID